MFKRPKILAISGSLRAASFNASILRTAEKLAGEKSEFIFYEGLADLPHFNPDEDHENVHESVTTFRNLLKEADAVIVCTPEYAFGLPGSLKNALDWVVSSGELNEKPVAAISASPLPSGGEKALSALLLVFSALGVNINDQTTLSIPGIKVKLDEQGNLKDGSTIEAIGRVVEALMLLV